MLETCWFHYTDRLCLFRAGDRTCGWWGHISGGVPGEAPESPLCWDHQVLRVRYSGRRHIHHVLFLILP
jgi:hypothetical protein